MSRICITLCLLALALTPGVASADQPATDPRARGLIGAALEYWQAQGVQACPDGIEAVYADLTMEVGRSYLDSCWAALDREWTFGYFRNAINRLWRRRLAAYECKAWTHEIGHALGVDHQPDHPIMDEWALMDWYGAPAECWRIARVMVPIRHRARRGTEA
jgi:hypothetical protein